MMNIKKVKELSKLGFTGFSDETIDMLNTGFKNYQEDELLKNYEDRNSLKSVIDLSKRALKQRNIINVL